MCSVMLPVTPNLQGRIIYRCEHGTFHLGWNRGMIHLAEDELMYLAHLLSLQGDEYSGSNSELNVDLIAQLTPDGMTIFELRVWEAALRLSLSDLEVLKELVGSAMAWLDEQPLSPQPAEQPTTVGGVMGLERQPHVDRIYLN